MIKTRKDFICRQCNEVTPKANQHFVCDLILCGSCYYHFKKELTGEEKVFYLLFEFPNKSLFELRENILLWIKFEVNNGKLLSEIQEELEDILHGEFERLADSGKGYKLLDLEVLNRDLDSSDFMQANDYRHSLAESIVDYWKEKEGR